MIPIEKYQTIGNITYVTTTVLEEYHTPDEVIRFGKWFAGQTGIRTPEGELGIYSWDYERWYEQGMKTKQGLDWD